MNSQPVRTYIPRPGIQTPQNADHLSTGGSNYFGIRFRLMS